MIILEGVTHAMGLAGPRRETEMELKKSYGILPIKEPKG
jgi:hypothetical protein